MNSGSTTEPQPATLEDPAAWILERIAEEEQLAQAATPPPWEAVSRPSHRGEGHYYGKVAVDVPGRRKWLYWGGSEDGPTAEHVATWDPARVLGECDTKRKIIERHSHYSVPVGTWQPKCDYCHQPWPCPDFVDIGAIWLPRWALGR